MGFSYPVFLRNNDKPLKTMGKNYIYKNKNFSGFWQQVKPVESATPHVSGYHVVHWVEKIQSFDLQEISS